MLAHLPTTSCVEALPPRYDCRPRVRPAEWVTSAGCSSDGLPQRPSSGTVQHVQLSEDLTTALIAAAGLVLAALVSAWLRLPNGLRDPRHDIERDLAILNDLPEQSGARAKLLSSIEERLVSLVTQSGDVRRNWIGVFLGLSLALASGLGAWRFATWGGWWWVGAIPCGLFAVAMLGILPGDWNKVRRNKRGQAIDPST